MKRSPAAASLLRSLAFAVLAVLAMPLLTSCSTPPILVYQAPNGGKLTHIGSGTFLEDSDYEEINDFIKLPGLEYRNRSKKHGKRQTTVANNVVNGQTALGLGKQAFKNQESNNALQLGRTKEATKQVGILTAPTKYLPAEGEAISRATDAGVGVVMP
jgi:hypothetical protein